jgi:hypothetical protein
MAGALDLTEPAHLLTKLQHEFKAVAADHSNSCAAITHSATLIICASARMDMVVSRLFRTFGLAERRPALAYAVMAPLIC